MTLEEQANILNQIKEAVPDNPTIASLCVKLSEDYAGVTGQITSLTSDLENSKKKCDQYADLNNQMWLKLNTKNGINLNTQTQESDSDKDQVIVAEKRNYSDLDGRW